MPHENGALWLDAITRPFMPRLFFPSKTAINDSERTNYYTGLAVAGAEEGTSISLGYVAESYIDFGAIYDGTAVRPGVDFGGLLSQNAYFDRPRTLLGRSLATGTIYGATFLELSITKVFGNLVVTILVSWVILRFFAPLYLPWLRTPAARIVSMRLLHVIPSVSVVHGGPPQAIIQFEKSLSAAGVSVTTVTTDDDGPGRRLKL